MNPRTLLPLLAAVSVLAAFSPASAQMGMGGRDPIAQIQAADTNNDGVITRDEYAAMRAGRFDQMDRNHDGYLSRDDLGPMAKMPRVAQRIDKMLAEADADHDGRVSKAEMARAPMPMFDRLDTNHDGKIDAAELAAAKARMAARQADGGGD